MGTLVLANLLGPEAALGMSSYKWKFRPLLVFAENGTNASLSEQRRIVATSRPGLAERDVVVIWIVGDNVSADLGPHPRESASTLRTRFGTSTAAFRAVLVGKDGGTKLMSSSPLMADALYATIDSMPMRRDEMRRE